MGERISPSRAAKGERGIWQRRYWEHTIRDTNDFARHVDRRHGRMALGDDAAAAGIAVRSDPAPRTSAFAGTAETKSGTANAAAGRNLFILSAPVFLVLARTD
jgi:hypothetical protein